MKQSTPVVSEHQPGNHQQYTPHHTVTTQQKPVDNRESTATLSQLKTAMEHAPQTIAQRKLREQIHNAPHMTKQRQLFAKVRENTAQRLTGKTVIQRQINMRKQGAMDTVTANDMAGIAAHFGFSVNALMRSLKNALFATNLIPATYQAKVQSTPELQTEVTNIIRAFDPLIGNVNQSNYTVTGENPGPIAQQIWYLIKDQVDNNFLRNYAHFAWVGTLVLFQFDIAVYSTHKIFCHKAQNAANGYSIDKCCNTVTGYLVSARWVSFSVPLTALGLLTRE